MPLEPPDLQRWRAAVGFAELQMFQDANEELEKIDAFNRAAPEVLAVRIAIYHALQKWELMAEIAKRLADFQPDDVQWTISAGVCDPPREFDQNSAADFVECRIKIPE